MLISCHNNTEYIFLEQSWQILVMLIRNFYMSYSRTWHLPWHVYVGCVNIMTEGYDKLWPNVVGLPLPGSPYPLYLHGVLSVSQARGVTEQDGKTANVHTRLHYISSGPSHWRHDGCWTLAYTGWYGFTSFELNQVIFRTGGVWKFCAFSSIFRSKELK